MAKTLIEIPSDIIERLDLLASEQKVSRSALIRKAIMVWLEEQKIQKIPNVFGILKGKKVEDGVEYQRKLRSEWK